MIIFLLYGIFSLERIIKASGSAADRKAAAIMVQRIQQEVAVFGGCLLPKLTTEFCWIEAALLPCKVSHLFISLRA